MSLLIADSAAVTTTRFSTVAADVNPSPSNICTNGLLFESIDRQG
ncbi:Uncharacterised protein [Mycobacteroides abscessus subsp. abscessus]|nr:Uncharacterised protein [Mycobacteroides abscessus subsp. abscessus]